MSISIVAPVAKMWDALTRLEQIKQYFLGTDTTTGWKPGSPICWRGDWQGKTYEDKGRVLEMQEYRRIVLSH